MNRSEQINELATALAAAQAGMTGVKKNRTVTVKTKSGGSYEFDYATLDAIIEQVRAPLTLNGLWFTQTLESGDEGKYRLVTTLVHKSGQWLASETPIVVGDGENRNQAFGSGLTYMRRYALAAMLGVASEDDDDANEADGNTVQARQDRQAPKSIAPIYANGAKVAAPNGKNGTTTAEGWVKTATEKVNVCKTADELKEWQKKNHDNLELLKTRDTKASNTLQQLIDDRLDRLNVLAAV
jgi:hypothetical protein